MIFFLRQWDDLFSPRTLHWWAEVAGLLQPCVFVSFFVARFLGMLVCGYIEKQRFFRFTASRVSFCTVLLFSCILFFVFPFCFIFCFVLSYVLFCLMFCFVSFRFVLLFIWLMSIFRFSYLLVFFALQGLLGRFTEQRLFHPSFLRFYVCTRK